MVATPRLLSENEYLRGTSDYARSLRTIFGNDGYQRYCAKINSIIEEGRKNNKIGNPLSESLDARIAYLEEELAKATLNTRKTKNLLAQCRTRLSGMLRLSKIDETDLAIKQRNFDKADSDEDFYRFELLNALHEKGVLG